MMIDIENAIGNLQILRTWCAVNPRYSRGLDAGDCEKAVGWLDDALKLLKAQQPRVLTLEEACDAEVCWLEGKGYESCATFDACHWNKTTYNKGWRCWNVRPTDEERKAVKWDE